jgi:DNA-binding NtrC family response regulator
VRDGIVVGPSLAKVHGEVVALSRAGQGLFVYGESGTGKEIAARLYHESGPRRGGPFLAVNCATIPKDLAERLLFGAVRGAYSGAVADAEGFLRAASGGTLFLDEVAELDLAVQAKLLRALEMRSVVPLGGTRALPIDVGLCAASLTDLRQAVARRSFRQDLYYRIGLPEVHVPPLRERSEEVPALIALTLQRTSSLGAAPSLIEACLLRPWPGNVRELCAAVGAAAALSAAAGAATVSDRRLAAGAGLPLGAAPPAGPPPAAAAPAAPPEADRLFGATAEALGLTPRTARKLFQPALLAELHRRAEQEGLDEAARHDALRALAAQSLLAILEARGYRRRQVAADLGLGRTTLFRLIDDLDLPRATTLGATDIARARAQAGGDMDAAALLLRVSPSALRQRVAALERSG